jgi:hypothetical protein
MLPTQNTAHVAEGNALLTSRYRNTAVTAGILKALLLRIQAKENDLYALLNTVQLANHPLAGGPWQILDQLGAIVGVTRDGRNDTDYLAVIKIKIRINRSHGLAEDIIQIAALVIAGAHYREDYPASFTLEAFSITTAVRDALLAYLHEARSAATEGFLVYSLTSPVLILDSSRVALGAATALDSARTPGSFPNLLTSMRVL